jgi:HAD superfamily hydrolase (TIGR01549 family)
MYKGILLDIDNTLYEYEPLHEQALEAVFDYIQDYFSIDKTTIGIQFKQAKSQIKKNTPYTAASHNRLLYMQNLCELLEINVFINSLTLYNIYWDTFLKHLFLSDGAQEFLARYGNLPICLLTDLTAHIQHRKVSRLNLYHWADHMVTSEEAGCEKPHPFMFELALQKLNLQASEVCMIGDSFKNDIKGATRLGIHSYWLCPSERHVEHSNITCIANLGDIQW